MLFLMMPNCFNVNLVCGVNGSTGACDSDCSSKCYLCSCNNGYGSCRTAAVT